MPCLSSQSQSLRSYTAKAHTPHAPAAVATVPAQSSQASAAHRFRAQGRQGYRQALVLMSTAAASRTPLGPWVQSPSRSTSVHSASRCIRGCGENPLLAAVLPRSSLRS